MTELTSATFIAPTGVRGAFASLLLSVSRHRLAAIGLFERRGDCDQAQQGDDGRG
jgi:hypothetical protein